MTLPPEEADAMPRVPDVRAMGERMEHLLDAVESSTDLAMRRTAAELLELVTELYGAGLARMMELVAGQAPDLVAAFAGDELVASLLAVHGLHPQELSERVESALVRVRPFLAAHGGDVELVDLDVTGAAVRVRLLGSCDGCPSSQETLVSAVEEAITDVAPEILRIELDQPSSGSGSPPLGGHATSEGPPVPVVLGPKPSVRGRMAVAAPAGRR